MQRQYFSHSTSFLIPTTGTTAAATEGPICRRPQSDPVSSRSPSIEARASGVIGPIRLIGLISPSTDREAAVSFCNSWLPRARSLSSPGIDAIWPNGVADPFSLIGIHRDNALENHRVGWERCFLCPLLPSVDRVGTRQKEHYPDWILGVQPCWQRAGVELFYLLPA